MPSSCSEVVQGLHGGFLACRAALPVLGGMRYPAGVAVAGEAARQRKQSTAAGPGTQRRRNSCPMVSTKPP